MTGSEPRTCSTSSTSSRCTCPRPSASSDTSRCPFCTATSSSAGSTRRSAANQTCSSSTSFTGRTGRQQRRRTLRSKRQSPSWPLSSARPECNERDVRPNLIGPLSAIGAAVLFGPSWVATGIALAGFSPYGLAVVRSIVTIVILTPVVFQLTRREGRSEVEEPGTRSGRFWRVVVLGLLGGALFGIGMNVAVSLTGAAVTALVGGAYPVVAAALAPLI